MRPCLILSVLFTVLAASGTAADAVVDGAAIDRLTGLKGALNEQEGVYKISAPRTDLPVTVDGVRLPPFMGLTSWVAFQADPKGGVMVMGDLVLFEDEVQGAMSAALDHGLAVTALHNHFFYDQPKVYFMHIGGQGELDAMASAVRIVLDQVQAIRKASPQVAQRFEHAPLPEKNAVSPEPIERILGVKVMAKDGMAKAVIGRTARMPCGCTIGKEMGVNTWAAFMGDDQTALVDGDFVVATGELQPVLKSLRAGGIAVVAIHSHMEGEEPRLIFLHYWGVGAAAALATQVKAALSAQKQAADAP